MGSGASTLEGVDKTKLEALQAELKKPVDLSDLAEGSAKDEVKKIRELFNASGLDKVGSDEVKKEAGKPADCSDIADDGKAELTRLRSLLSKLNAKEGSPENSTAENPNRCECSTRTVEEITVQQLLENAMKQSKNIKNGLCFWIQMTPSPLPHLGYQTNMLLDAKKRNVGVRLKKLKVSSKCKKNGVCLHLVGLRR